MATTPKTIKAICVVKNNKLSPFEVYHPSDEDGIILNDDEKMCDVEIKFIKYHG